MPVQYTCFAAAGYTGILVARAVVAGLQHCEGGKPSLGLGLVVVVEHEVEGIAVDLWVFGEFVTWRPGVFGVLVRRER